MKRLNARWTFSVVASLLSPAYDAAVSEESVSSHPSRRKANGFAEIDERSHAVRGPREDEFHRALKGRAPTGFTARCRTTTPSSARSCSRST